MLQKCEAHVFFLTEPCILRLPQIYIYNNSILWHKKNRPNTGSSRYQGDVIQEQAYAACRSKLSSAKMAMSAFTSASTCSAVCSGDGVMRRRSVPRGTVGKLIGWT